jgi:5-methylcytosine-specific restriction endonuclease McrA
MTLVESTRKKFYEKAKGKCMYCGRSLMFREMIIEHKTPKSRGGSNVISDNNLTVSCNDCNTLKGSKTVDEFKEYLKELPDLLYKKSNKFRGVFKFYEKEFDILDFSIEPQFYFERKGIKI